jgi:hypothetical protein
VTVSCEGGSEPLEHTRGEGFLHLLSHCLLLKKEVVTWCRVKKLKFSVLN